MEKINQIQNNISGEFFTRPTTLADVKELTALFNLSSQETMGINEFSENEVETNLNLPGLEINEDTRLITNADGKIVAYARLFAQNDVPVTPAIFARVHPEYLNMGLGTYLHLWGMESAKRVFNRLDDDLQVAVQTWVEHQWKPAIDLFLNNGMHQSRLFFSMKIEMENIPAKPSWPDGIEIKQYNHPEQARPLFQTIEDSFKDHYGYVDQDFEIAFKQFSHQMFNDEGFDPDIWFLAMDGEKIAGLSLCRKMGRENVEEGYVYYLSVLPEYRRKGLASSLLIHSFREYFIRNKKTVTLDVDGKNLTGAVAVYKKVGMALYRQYNQYEIEIRPGRNIRKS
jgi:mycothiol synthase